MDWIHKQNKQKKKFDVIRFNDLLSLLLLLLLNRRCICHSFIYLLLLFVVIVVVVVVHSWLVMFHCICNNNNEKENEKEKILLDSSHTQSGFQDEWNSIVIVIFNDLSSTLFYSHYYCYYFFSFGRCGQKFSSKTKKRTRKHDSVIHSIHSIHPSNHSILFSPKLIML